MRIDPTGRAVCAIALLVVMLGAAVALPAQPLVPEGGIKLGDVAHGSLLLKTDRPGLYVPAPTLQTDVQMTVTGLIARVTVHQRFANPGPDWVEGVYVFPLPETSAVDHLRMRIGERVIEGRIQERAEAKRTYERAKGAGQRASLLEQERPNIFTASVANLGPGEEVTVEIEYQETVRYDQGWFRLRFPMVVGPRYIPGVPAPTGTDRVPDASRITPPVQHPKDGLLNPLSLTVDLLPGVPLARVESAYHPIVARQEPGGRRRITLQEGSVFADRDFELGWQPVVGQSPIATIFTERKDGETYALLMVLPPDRTPFSGDTPSRAAREVVFVIDTSGSMFGESIQQARAALTLALGRLTNADTFNVIQFNDMTGSLFADPQPATPENIGRAKRYVAALRATGGTEMRPALERAFNGTERPAKLRQVIFLTDGQIGNEAELFDTIRQRLGDRRLFTVGIGSAPNSHFMRHAAEFGRGSFTYIGNTAEVQEKMDGLFRKIEHPALMDLRLDLTGWEGAEVLPGRIPDLYLGEPLMVVIRAFRLPNSAVFRGRLGDRPWQVELPINSGEEREGLGVHWAREKIAGIENQPRDGQSLEARRAALVEVALRHHLVSRYTSLVAVDVTPVRPADKALAQAALKTNLPQGQDYTAIFGLPRTATPAGLHLIVGLLLLLLAAGLWRVSRRAACAGCA